MTYPPGPWHIDKLKIKSGNTTICEIYLSDKGDAKAIASLIAAVPEMRDALLKTQNRIQRIMQNAHRYDEETREHLDNIALAVSDAIEKIKEPTP